MNEWSGHGVRRQDKCHARFPYLVIGSGVVQNRNLGRRPRPRPSPSPGAGEAAPVAAVVLAAPVAHVALGAVGKEGLEFLVVAKFGHWLILYAG